MIGSFSQKDKLPIFIILFFVVSGLASATRECDLTLIGLPSGHQDPTELINKELNPNILIDSIK